MKTMFNRWPGGHFKCLTLSYDDGVVEDRELVSIMNRHGIRGTFHLNSGLFGTPGRLNSSDVASLYAGHEISTHMVMHPFPTRLTREEILAETLEDRRSLEALAGYPVRGMSYPYGDYDARVIELLRACGIEYARTVRSTGQFDLPTDWLEWHPTCHHHECLTHADRFLETSKEPWRQGLFCFYVWGHSYEFPNNKNWNLIETFCDKLGHRDDIWYATNMEIVDYIRAVREVRSSADGTLLYNPSAQSVWLTIVKTGENCELKAGQTIRFPA
jgi:peptidoglycan/xylan/chitin deacetylase (PgdA/CDA1 family)